MKFIMEIKDSGFEINTARKLVVFSLKLTITYKDKLPEINAYDSNR